MDPIEKKLHVLREVAIRYLEANRPEKWDVHVTELQRGAVMHVDGKYRIGRWVWDEQASTLLREPDVAPMTLAYGLRFERIEGMNFKVLNDFWQREEWKAN